MPTNVDAHYLRAEQEYHEAETTQQKLKALKKMLALAPSHKGAEKLRKNIKERIRRTKYKQEQEKKVGKGKSFAIKKDGAATVVIIGLPNSGKSTLLSKLSGKKVRISEYEFTTKNPEVRMIPFENIQFQGIEIPSIYKGFSDSKRGPQMLSLVRNADVVLLVLSSKNRKKEADIINSELERAGIKLSGSGFKGINEFIIYINSLAVFTSGEGKNLKFISESQIKSAIWNIVGKIRVLTKSKEGMKDKKPMVLRRGSTVGDAARQVHKDFVKNFRFAKIWGPSSKFDGQQVGLDHKLKDNDTIEIFTK